MDDPADTCWSWPHWKFGLRKDDLFSKLHDQYNTVTTPLLDPEAFHHDVYEISSKASSSDEFHSLLRERKQQRLRELNESLESAALEIIANPSLIGTEQWEFAVQLFRTKSLDSLVRYFSSYLPADHPWKRDSTTSSQISSSDESCTNSSGYLFDDDDGPIMTDEPLDYSSSHNNNVLPPSPRSMTMCSLSSAASPIDGDTFDINTLTPARTASYSESEPDCCALSEHCSHTHTHTHSHLEDTEQDAEEEGAGVGDDVAATALSESTDATPIAAPDLETPKPEGQSFFEKKLSLSHRRHRSLSPSRPYPLSEQEVGDIITTRRDPRSPLQCAQLSKWRRDRSPMQRRRKGPGEATTRIHKPSLEVSRSRQRVRRGLDG
ncbi:hypothetical protein QBC42DRAFT_267983 [Cladorrhinum samala]|uniref:Uncharacterized protein n=1 Tax=Cladorrhinum samala TaxID=585594 RepID=A0AAV9HQP4_9PEZI|nr:hypothetical protein QBC42DRAFT_267983 [Cladorrhinum samala]